MGVLWEHAFVVVALDSRLSMFSMRESITSVRVYLRWNRENVYTSDWVCLSVGILPWYMVVRLVSSMCMSQLHPSVWRGVLAEMILRVGERSTGMLCCDLCRCTIFVMWSGFVVLGEG